MFRYDKRLCFTEVLLKIQNDEREWLFSRSSFVIFLQTPSIKSRFWLYAMLFAAALLFYFCHERLLTGYDPASFALAIKFGYSVQQARPHGPGYPGFYLLWKFIAAVTGLSPHATILAANLGFSLLAIILIFYCARQLYSDRTAIIAAMLALANPLLLYFGNSTELYAYDAAFSAFIVILLVVYPLRAVKSQSFETILYFLYGLLGAFRLSSIILTIPVVLISFALRYRRDRTFSRIWQDTLAIALGTLAWFVPFLMNIGGWGQFVSMIEGVSNLPTSLLQNLGRFVPAILWMVNVLFIIAAMNARQIWNTLRRFEPNYIILLSLIAVPSLFFAFRYYEKGYALLIFAPVALMGARLIERGRRPVLTSIAAVSVSLLLFVAVPFIPPSALSFLNHRHRTKAERFASFLERETSFFAPTLSHLRASDDASEKSARLIGALPKGSAIMIDPSAEQWAYARTLQFEQPEMIFLAPSETDSAQMRRFAGDSLDYTYTWDDFRIYLDNKAAFYYLTDRELPDAIGDPPANFVNASGHTALFYVPRDSFEVLKKYNRTFFYRSE